MTITIEIDPADLTEPGVIQHLMQELGGKQATIRSEGYSLTGYVRAMSAA